MMFIQLCCDDEPKFSKLPADTLAILNEFYQEQNENSRKEEQGDIGEDWVKYCLIRDHSLFMTEGGLAKKGGGS
jgi:hypothetical protein